MGLKDKNEVIQKRIREQKFKQKRDFSKVKEMHINNMLDHRAFVKFVVVPCVVLFLGKQLVTSGLFESPTYRGEGFSIICPEGWEKMDKKEKYNVSTGIFLAEDDYDTITFIIPFENIPIGRSRTTISVFATQTRAPMWIEDIFPSVMQLIMTTPDFQYMDRGELKIDGQISKWVLYQDTVQEVVNMEFYMVDERNGVYKLRYQADLDNFTKHRPAFEKTKDTFTFSKGLF